jgi:hypothetical protein
MNDSHDITHLCGGLSLLLLLGRPPTLLGNGNSLHSPSVSVSLWESGATSMFPLQSNITLVMPDQ